MHNSSSLSSRSKMKDGSVRPFLLYDGRFPALARLLEPYGSPVALPPFDALPAPVCGHPDLLTFFHAGALYTFARYYAENRALFDVLPCEIEPLDLQAGDYPRDLWFDCLPLGGALLFKAGCAPEKISAHFTAVPVSQGYARCSALCPGGRALITADRGIARAAEELGARVLLIRPGSIALPGYGEGFIGGASAVVGKTVLFFGDLSAHPCGKQICAFLRAQGYEAVSFPSFGEPTDCCGLTDCGGLTVVR